jgi:oxygen-independent coproporphyrinogen-3 oxidase
VTTAERDAFRRQLRDNAYPGYVYGYPHKKAYRPLAAPRTLDEVWAGEPRRALSCYVHVPFCNQRCSFCNLFTFVPPGASPAGAYLDALEREAAAYGRVLGPEARFARLYIGGGTPTYFTDGELRRLVSLLRDNLGVRPQETFGCIEASPETLDEGKVALLRELGFQRLSLGVQSFVAEELRQVNRRFDFALNRRAVDLVGRAGFPHFNVDLIYGLPGQTAATWRRSLDEAIDSAATSLFLYPLYVRPLTGLDRRADVPPCPTTHEMGAMYDAAREQLSAAGFTQITMRQFLRGVDLARPQAAEEDREYRCQRDATVGLGAGARSYTGRLHYSTPWKMIGHNIRGVVEGYVAAVRRGDFLVRHGFELDDDETRRRFTILSLLYDGLDLRAFADLFRTDAIAEYAGAWDLLREEGCVEERDSRFRLTPRGVRHADVVGQLFFSERVRRLIDEYEYDR